MLMRPRVLLLLVLVVLVVVVLVFGVSSCLRRNNDASSQTIEETKPKNEQDNRVAAGVSAAMTSRFTEALDKCDLLASIAKNANLYDDDRLLMLALNESDAIPFVAAYPTSDKSTRPYDGDVSRGEVPSLFNWDEHWGAVTYGDGPLAVTGSGPTTLAMAYMGLTGKTDYSPTEIAQQASKSNYADGESGSKTELFTKTGGSLGLVANEYSPSVDTITTSLGETTVIAAEVKSGTLTDEAHWVLLVNINADGSVTVFDPTSTEVSNRPWDPNTIAESSTTLVALSPSDTTLAKIESESSGSATNSVSSSSSSNSSTSANGSNAANGTSSSSASGLSSISSDETSEEEAV